MKRLRIVAILAFSAVLCLVAGFWFGVREGAKYDQLTEEPALGVLATYALVGLNKEEPKVARFLLDRQVDSGLVSAHDFLNSPIRSIIGPALGTGTNVGHIEDFAIRLAKYRKANPSAFPDEYLSHFPEETTAQRALIDDVTERRREAVRIIDSMVEQYASK
jgi:hypothetical protein